MKHNAIKTYDPTAPIKDKYEADAGFYKSLSSIFENWIVQLIVEIALIACDASTTYLTFRTYLATNPWVIVLLTASTATLLQLLPYFGAIALRQNEYEKNKYKSTKVLGIVLLASFALLLVAITIITFLTTQELFLDSDLAKGNITHGMILSTAGLLSLSRLLTSVVSFYMAWISNDFVKKETLGKLKRESKINIMRVNLVRQKVQNSLVDTDKLYADEEAKRVAFINSAKLQSLVAKALCRQILAQKSGLSADQVNTVTDKNIDLAKAFEAGNPELTIFDLNKINTTD